MQSNQINQGGFEEYKKIFCAYHKTEFLTNFCVDSIYPYNYNRNLFNASLSIMYCRPHIIALQIKFKTSLYEPS
jgi:hypothetical protein